MRSDEEKKLKSRRKRIVENIVAFFILGAIFIGGVTGYYGSKIFSFMDTITVEETVASKDDSLETLKNLEEAEPFAALILGTDVVEEGQARSDTIIVVTVNPEEESMKMLSVPRDTLVTLPNGLLEKINAAYATGGAVLSMTMIEEMLNIPIDFYATMDFRGLVELVDAVGGITVDSELEFTEDNYMDRQNPIYIQEGMQKLDGAEALGYARMRKQDPRGDFGRQDRQKEVIVEVLNELVSLNTITNLTDILNSVSPYLRTNVLTNQMLTIAANYPGVINDIEQLSMEGVASETYFPHYGLNVYVWEPYQESLWEVSNELRGHLGLEENTKPIEEVYSAETY